MKKAYTAINLKHLEPDERREMKALTAELTQGFEQYIDYLDDIEPESVILHNDAVVAASFAISYSGEYKPEVVVHPDHQRQGLGSYLLHSVIPAPEQFKNEDISVELTDSDSLPFAYKNGFHVADEYGDGVTLIEPLNKSDNKFVDVFQRNSGHALHASLKEASGNDAEYASMSQALRLWVENLPYEKNEAPLPFAQDKMEDILLSLPLSNYERTFLWTQMNTCSETPSPAPGPYISDLTREERDKMEFDNKDPANFVTRHLSRITPETAKTWHEHLVPKLRENIEVLKELVDAFEPDGVAEMPQATIQDIKLDLKKETRALDMFLSKFPAPEAVTLKTDFNSNMDLGTYSALFKNAEFSQSLPNKDLTLLGYDEYDQGMILKGQGTLLYSDDEGNHYKCPNVPYNQPENRKSQVWGPEYGSAAKPAPSESQPSSTRPRI